MPENKRYDRVKEITDQLEQGIKDLFNSEQYVTWLKTMSRFHDYSLNNTLLISFQKPDATLVAGYAAWKNQFGRQVQRGQKAIRIVAPAPYKQKIETEKMDPVTKLPVRDADGKIVTEMKEVLRPAFKVVNVFDVSQTEGRELPTLGVNELSGDVRDYDLFFEALKKSCPVPIELKEIKSGAKGYYHMVDKRIGIQKGMSQLQTVKTAIHEMAHQKLHAIDPDSKEPKEKDKTRNSKEVEAESVAYTVCQRFGLDTSDYSFAYIAGWSHGKDIPELKASLKTIREASSEMIDVIEAQIRNLKKEREAEQEASLEGQPSITFYAAECMEFPDLGEHHTGLSLEEAFQVYDSIPAGRMNGIKGIGFELHDGSIYEGDFPLMVAESVQKESIEMVRHFMESPLVQKAVRDCETILKDRAVLKTQDTLYRPSDSSVRKEIKKSVLADLREKKIRVNGANAPEKQTRNRRKDREKA